MPTTVSKSTNPELVDFIGIGAVKSGTTWLVENLNKAEQIFIPEKKEIYYFGYEQNGGFYDKGLEWYLAHFKKAKEDQLKGEFTTHYMFLKEAPKLIHKYNPNVKILICLRNPIAMVYSYYWWRKSNFTTNTIPASFEEDFDANPEYKNRGMYYTQLKRFFDLFPKENIHIIMFEDIKKHPKEVLTGVFEFLGVSSPAVPQDFESPVNEAKTVRYPVIASAGYLFYETLKKLGFKDLARNIICHSPLTVLYGAINKRKFKYEPMSMKTKQKLRTLFKEDIDNLGKLIDRDLSVWLQK